MRRFIVSIIILMAGIVFSLAAQTVILSYISNFYCADTTEVAFKQVVLQPVISNKIEIKLTGEARNIRLSPSGKYCSYYGDNTFNVINLIDGNNNTLKLDKNIDSYFFKWHASEDRLIISEKTIQDNKAAIKIYTYNTKDNLKQEALNYNNTSAVYKLPVSNAAITDIQLNTMNTIIYLKASSGPKISYLERLDISEGMNKLSINTANIGNFSVLKQKDELIYENLTDGKIYMTNKSKTEAIKVPDFESLKFLNVDKHDTVYIGELQNNRISQIFIKDFSGSIESTDLWRSTSLLIPLEENEVHILNSGKIYVVNELEGTVKNIEDNNKINFKGNFIDMNDSGVLSLYEQNLIITTFK